MLKINNTFIDNAEDLDIVISMYIRLEYSDNYSMTSGSLWNYYRDEKIDAAHEDDAANDKINNDKGTTSRPSEYKTNMRWNTLANNDRLDTEVNI